MFNQFRKKRGARIGLSEAMHRPMRMLLALSLGLFTGLAEAAPRVDPQLPAYVKTSGVAGVVSSVGSDTLAGLMSRWAQSFQRIYPRIQLQIQAAGSATAPPALTEGTASLGPMSRLMNPAERRAFEKRYGYAPTAVPVAIDALAVYVHQDNPLKGLTLAQLDSLFSVNRRCGGQSVSRWRDLGVEGPLAVEHIQRYGRNAVSGTYSYFKEHALCGGDFLPNISELPGSAAVVQAISSSPNAIGYSGIGYRTASVKALALARQADEPLVAATPTNASNGSYPLARYLYVYVNQAPGQPLPPQQQELLNYMLSREGQLQVVQEGYVPLTAEVASTSRKLYADVNP
ncbi:PstS family phosphate ABC transporter substrate-binding protein [Pokkaliibacter sp. CJK22405]|uniref:PstS family phosphate ABC transporter substrate-binding protein n=1 Tax=Pokkaliibacter sp. CJK22405 TaxID=3384615 RepID=UPI00398545C6